MKIKISLTIEVDPKEWGYGTGDSAAEVRADVRRYVLNSVQNLAGIAESDATVTMAGDWL